MTNEELIAEARRLENDYSDSHEVMLHMSDLADALEASEARIAELEAQVKDFKCEQVFRISELQELLEAQQRISELEDMLAARQPSEDGKYILRLIETIKQTGGSVEVAGVKIMPCDEFGRTAAVPDAATGELERAHDLIDLREFEIDNLHELITELRAERDAALAAAARAAQGAAPQAESEQQWNDPSDPNSPQFDSPWVKAAALIRSIRCAQWDMLERRGQEDVRVEIYGLIDRLDELATTMLAAPVLPSSGADEERLAEYARVKQAEALEEFAEKWATADGMEALMFATNAEEAVMATERELLACAAEYRKGESND